MKNQTAEILNVKNSYGVADTTATVVVKNSLKRVPKVSVIIPVYNVEQYLRECLDSVLNQTLKDIEVICIDDGSTDSSLDILKEYAKCDNRITVMTQKNLHAGVARNAGLAVAKGQYIHFMDSDDWVEPDILEQLVDIMDSKHPDFIKFKNYLYDCDKKQDIPDDWISISFLPKNMFNKILGDESKVLLTDLPDSPWSGLYDLKFLNDNSIRFDSMKCCNDVSFFLRTLVAAKKIYVSDKTYVHYRTNRPGSLILNRVYNFDCQIQLFYTAQQVLIGADNKLKNKFLAHLLDNVVYRFKGYAQSDIDMSLKTNLFQQVLTFLTTVPSEVSIMCKSAKIIKNIQTTNDFDKFMKNKSKRKLFYKERRNDGERRIYIFGIRVFSYKKGCVKHALEYPIRVHEKYHRLKNKIREIKNSK